MILLCLFCKLTERPVVLLNAIFYDLRLFSKGISVIEVEIEKILRKWKGLNECRLLCMFTVRGPGPGKGGESGGACND